MGTKENLLSLLENRRNEILSGELIASHLKISRAAVWKAMGVLKKQGLKIESIPGSGYRLLPESDLLSHEGILAWLPSKQTHVQILHETSSTNLVAKEWALNGAPHGSLVAANSQTSGKGRLGRTFASPPGGIYMSIILRPHCPATAAVMVTTATAVAVCDAVSTLCGKQLGIKWVNDLFFEKKKCCGILSEAGTSFETGEIDYIVVGIGLNFSTSSAFFKGELQNIAGSVYPSGNAPVPRAQLIADIHTRLLAYFTGLPNTGFLEEYRRRSIVLGKEITVLSALPYTAKAIAINNEGHLVVKPKGLPPCALPAGEISIKL